jgi:hypothetical protein
MIVLLYNAPFILLQRIGNTVVKLLGKNTVLIGFQTVKEIAGFQIEDHPVRRFVNNRDLIALYPLRILNTAKE